MLGLIGGLGVALYLLLWLVLPAADGGIVLEQAARDGDVGAAVLVAFTLLTCLGVAFGGQDGGPLEVPFIGLLGLMMTPFIVWYFVTRPGRATAADRGQTDRLLAAPPGYGGPEPLMTPAGQAPHAFSRAYGARADSELLAPSPRPARAPRARRKVLDPWATLAILGVAILVGVTVATIADRQNWSGNHQVEGLLATVITLGLATLLAGIAGRRAGFLVVTTLIAAILTAPLSAFPASISLPPSVGQRTIAPPTLSSDETHRLGMGELWIDLSRTQVEPEARGGDGPVVITADVGAGELYVLSAPGQVVEVRASVRFGAITSGSALSRYGSPQRPGGQEQAGAGITSNLLIGSGPPDVIVEATVGMGEIRISTPVGESTTYGKEDGR